MRNNLVLIITVLIFLPLLFLEIQCNNPTVVESTKIHFASLDTNTKYVGMNNCRGCHQGIYETFIRTGMGLSLEKASKKKSSAKFDDHALVYDKYKDFYYHPFWAGDSLRIMEFRIYQKDTIYKRVETVKYIIGSGQHTNSHIYNVNGYLFQAPMTYYTQQGTWDLPPGFENGNNSRFNRNIGLECMSCHNGYPTMELGSENKYSYVPQGIDCERCHGPGSKHISDKMAGKIIDVSKDVDYSIVNPAKLPIDLQFDVCQRCHIQGNAVLVEGKSFYDFRPGMRLSEVMNVFMPVYKGRKEEHIMASHAERLKQSLCYLKTTEKLNTNNGSNHFLMDGEKGLTCITCHNPHVSRLETTKETFNTACRNCHRVETNNYCLEDELVLKKNNSNCVVCHMPENKTVDIPHVRIHDHKISIPVSAEEKSKVKEFVGIVAINNPNPAKESIAQAYINYFEKFGFDISVLDSALFYVNHKTKDEICRNIKLLVNIYFLRHEYLKVIEYVNSLPELKSKINTQSFDNYDAWTCYRIAESYYRENQLSTAIIYYKKSYELAPLDPKFANEYAEHLALSGGFRAAKNILESIIKMQPNFAPSYSNLSFIYLSEFNNLAMAEELNEKALSLDPDYEAALMNKVAIFLIKKKNKEAINTLKRVIEINPLNPKAKIALKQILAA